MIKARAGNTVILGLTKRNLELLQEAKPIVFDASILGLPGIEIAITYGETEQHIMRAIGIASSAANTTIDKDTQHNLEGI
jgi:hypothetical protein